MSIELNVEVTGTVLDTGDYQLEWEVVNAIDMPAEVFLYTDAVDRFEGVIAPAQLTYPTEPVAGVKHYRRSTAVAAFPDQATAVSARDNVHKALRNIVGAYKAGLEDFLVTKTYTYPEDT